MILDKIKKELPEMAPNFRKIGSYILDHEQSVAFASIYTISKAIGVSNASLVRFAKSLELDGYQSFKHEIQDEIKHRLSPYEKIALRELDLLPEEKRMQKLFLNEVNNLRNTFDNIKIPDLQGMAESIRSARRIFICGFGASGHLARTFEYPLLSSIKKDVAIISGSVSDYTPRLRAFTAEDVMFILTFPPYSEEIRHVAKVVKTIGGTLNLFTDSAMCPIYSMADRVVKCDTNSLLLSNSYVGLVSILNILIHTVFLGSKDTSIEVRSQTLTMQLDGYASIQAAGEKA
ncbi:MAG: MurR/RpiR family transcriptional regulator [Spirochaetae bacterium HGW-Spirochaetae-9]|nr:MAG: MurR/RpiR family transcriptional regulator [Spirochaetae bacterium HGW-Spirochaetae-9]